MRKCTSPAVSMPGADRSSSEKIGMRERVTSLRTGHMPPPLRGSRMRDHSEASRCRAEGKYSQGSATGRADRKKDRESAHLCVLTAAFGGFDRCRIPSPRYSACSFVNALTTLLSNLISRAFYLSHSLFMCFSTFRNSRICHGIISLSDSYYSSRKRDPSPSPSDIRCRPSVRGG